jgi:AAA+ ATPase superfamily predicted ATPase
MNFNVEEGTLTCTLDSTDPMDVGRRLYRKKSVDFLSGTTIMVGPNGVGKTTLIRCIEDIFRDNNIKVFNYDNLHSSGSTSLSSALFYNDLSSFATMVSSSEGENILFNIRSSLGKIKRYVDSQMEKENEPAILLFDAIDSGLSLDFMFDIKRLFNAIVDSEPEEYQKRIFIICTSNSYELSRGFRCWDVKGSKEIYFNKYQEYADFIINTRRAIDKSIEKRAEQSNNDTIDD